MKRALFWILFIPLGFIVLLTDTCWWICRKYLAIHEVMYVLLQRFEHWSMGIPSGFMANCPWKKSIKEVWKENQ